MNEHIDAASKALRSAKNLARAAKIFGAAQVVALGGAAASLAIGGIRLFKQSNKNTRPCDLIPPPDP